MSPGRNRKSRKRGSAILEMALLGPCFFFLFIGSLDWGFIAYSLVSLESAARTAALYTSSGVGTSADSAGACALALGEMRKVPNIGPSITTCSGNPITVTASTVYGPDSAYASKVAVTYTTMPLIPIPGLLGKQFTITRAVTMRLRG